MSTNAVCSKCRAPIWWAMTTRGKRIPMDPDPDGRGNLVLVHPDGTALVRSQALDVATGRPTTALLTVARRGARSMGSPAGPEQLPFGDADSAVERTDRELLPRWRSHWATCPDADEFRGRRGTSR